MKLPLSILCILGITTARGQPDWLTAVIHDSHLPPFHRDAEYATLTDEMSVVYDEDGRAIIKARIAYRVLRPGGAEVTNIAIPTSPQRTLRSIRGWHIAAGKEPKTVDESDVVVLNPFAVAGYYTDARQSAVGFSGVQPDDVVGYEYEIEDEEPTARFLAIRFQARQPVASSTYSVTIPRGWSLQTAGHGLESVQRKTTGNMTVWSASDLPYVPSDPLTSPSSRPACCLAINVTGGEKSSFADWTQVADWTRARTEPAAVPDASISSLTPSLFTQGDSPWRKFHAAARFVQQDIRYVAVELGEGGWTPRRANETLKNRFGDCKDKATLLRSLLRAAGIPSAAVLASAGSPVFPELTSPYQFNHLIIAIPDSALGPGHPTGHAVADGWFFFDPTDWTVPTGFIPPVLEGSRVFVAEAGNTKLVTLPRTGADVNRLVIGGNGSLALDGLVSASVRMLFQGEDACNLRGMLRSAQDANALWLPYVRDAMPDAALNGVIVADSVDSLAVTFSITGRGLLSNAGVENMFRPNFLQARTPDRLTARTRSNPLWLGPASFCQIRIHWSYDGYLAGPDTLIRQSRTARGNSFSVQLVSREDELEFLLGITYSDDIIPASEYGSVRTYLSDLERAIATSVQLRRISR